jgi:hypothetical protein
MSENSVLQLALWFEVIGFITSSILLVTVKWDTVAQAIYKFRGKIIKNKKYELLVWIISHLITDPNLVFRQKWNKFPFLKLLWPIKFVLDLVLMSIAIVLVSPIYLLVCVQYFFFNKNKVTNTFIILGTCLGLSGLIMELVLSY